MLRNYLLTSLRYLSRNRQYAFINVVGLAIGIATSIVILLYARHELAYDRFHPDHERIYRIGQDYNHGEFRMTWLQMPHGEALAREHADVVEAVVRFQVRTDRLLTAGERQFTGETVGYADPNVFDIFGYELLHGDPRHALRLKESIVLSESLARKYFGKQDPIGQVVRVDRSTDFVVTGVMKNLPSYTHLKFDCLLNIERLPNVWNRTNDAWTYVKLRPGFSPTVLQDRSVQIFKKYLETDAPPSRFIIQPIGDIHLHSQLNGEPEINSDISLVITLLGIAGLVLLMGCMNYVNLATAQALRRFKEVGIRKVLGASRVQLIRQFTAESIVIVGTATLLGVGLAEAAIPSLGQWIGKEFGRQAESGIPVALIPLAVFFVVSLFATAYPTVFLSGQKPVSILKGERSGRSRLGFRKLLLISQFAITLMLMIGTWIALDQLEFVRNKPLGFEREHLVNLTVRDGERWKNRTEALRDELLTVPGVVEASSASFFVSGMGVEGSYLRPANKPEGDNRRLRFIKSDAHFPSTLGLELVAGRMFSNRRAGDTTGSFILNESAARLFLWSAEEAVGKQVTYNDWATGEVIGVVRDFHYSSLQNKIEPFALFCHPAMATRYRSQLQMTLRLGPDDVQETLRRIEKKMSHLSPEFPFEAQFVDQALEGHFRQDRVTGSLFGLFAVLAIVLACLGLFGLTSYSVQQKRKEIGIRKVLGASVRRLLMELSREYLVLIALASAVGLPSAYAWMNQWMSRFAYQAPTTWWPYPVTLVALVLIAWMAMFFQTARAATANPVEALKTE